MLNATTFQQQKDNKPKLLDLYASDLSAEIYATNEWVYQLVNNGFIDADSVPHNLPTMKLREMLEKAYDAVKRF